MYLVKYHRHIITLLVFVLKALCNQIYQLMHLNKNDLNLCMCILCRHYLLRSPWPQ